MIRVDVTVAAAELDRAEWHRLVHDRSGPVRRDLDARGTRVRRQMVRRCPRRTNRLASTIRGPVHGTTGGMPYVDVIAGREGHTPYLGFVIFGTQPHVIVPRRREVLRFTVDGRTVYTTRVRHPGTRPQPFMQQSLGAARF